MEYKDFSVKGIKVPCVGLGTWAIGGWQWGGSDEDKAIATIRKAVDMGITLVDTAPVYGFGRSETIVGKALAEGNRRDKVVLATKVGLVWDAEENVTRDSSLKTVSKQLEDSLRRLQTDYIDIYQIHWPDNVLPLQNTAELMYKFLQDGKIRAIGVSNFSLEQMKEWMKYAPIHSIQPPYNLFERDAEAEVIPFALANNISTLSYSSLCRGLLTGKYTLDTKFNEGDMRNSQDKKFQKENFKKYLEAIEEFKKIAEKYSKTVAQFAVRWVLNKGITTALWGARKVEQLDMIGGVSDWNISNEDLNNVENILKKYVPVPISPEFMAPPLN